MLTSSTVRRLMKKNQYQVRKLSLSKYSQGFSTWHVVPATQVPLTVQGIPPHWPNSGMETVVPVGLEALLVRATMVVSTAVVHVQVPLDVGMLVDELDVEVLVAEPDEQIVVVPLVGYDWKNIWRRSSSSWFLSIFSTEAPVQNGYLLCIACALQVRDRGWAMAQSLVHSQGRRQRAWGEW
jgi:hypothetical protein